MYGQVFCPTLFIPNLIDWGIEDPKGKTIDQVREIRDDIEQRVKQLVTNLPKIIDGLSSNQKSSLQKLLAHLL